jgi:hypothetical protein
MGQILEDRAKKQTQAIQAMQEVSYWRDRPGAIKIEPLMQAPNRVAALMRARKQVEAEIKRHGFIVHSVKASDITKAAEALVEAWPQVILDQAMAEKVAASPK